MMSDRRAFISCIHGNLPALEKALADIEAQRIQSVFCLGDMIGYGPWPNEVISLLQSRNIPCIKGCWEDAVLSLKEDCGCSFDSPEEKALGEKAFAWTQRELNGKSHAFLKTLPKHFEGSFGAGRILLVHGSPKSPYEYLQESTHDLVLIERAASVTCDLLVCGHTHIPFIKDVEGSLVVSTSQDVGGIRVPIRKELILNSKRIINAGSVGEPRQGGPELSWISLDVDSGEAEIHYCSYDMGKTLDGMRKKSIPQTMIERFEASQEMTAKKKDIVCEC